RDRRRRGGARLLPAVQLVAAVVRRHPRPDGVRRRDGRLVAGHLGCRAGHAGALWLDLRVLRGGARALRTARAGSVPVGAESPIVEGLSRREPATLVTGL